MKIIMAKTAGFCYGVKRAIELAEKTAKENGRCLSLGQLIHNDDMVHTLEKEGVHAVKSINDVELKDVVVIRSHGASRAAYEELEKKNAVIVDATCPSVKRIHKLVEQESENGRIIVIIGDPNHAEVNAISGWCGEAYVFKTSYELEKYLQDYPEMKEKPLCMVSQTTGMKSDFERSVKIIKKECTNYKIFDTICSVTAERQHEAENLAKMCDVMVVIGGKHSANSLKLAEICRVFCSKVFFVENADELCTSQIKGAEVVGITAGASTPGWIIKEVYRKMSDEINVSAVENEVATEEILEAKNPAEGESANTDAEMSFEEMLERSIKTLHTGEKVAGVIAAITSTEISVDLGTKQSGYIPVSEFTDDPSVNIADIIKIGDEIEAYVMRVNDVEGTVMLSKKRLDSVKAWGDISAARNERNTVEGVVVEENKGGIIVNVKGIRVFVPASQSGLPKDAQMSELLKKKVKLRITEVNQPRRRVVGSIRAAAFEERRAKAEQIWNEIEVGKRYKGTVKSMTSYGAFIDIGGIDGMVHVSELSWNRIHQPSDVIAVGDEIEVYVISFDKENRKISLGYKDQSENPWTKFTSTYAVGDVAEVKVVKLMQFGAFAEIVPGVDGLIHISQIADRRIAKPDDVLEAGQMVNAKITNVDEENHKVSLSIRALLEAETPAPAEEADDEESAVVYDTENPSAFVEETEE